MFRREQTSPAQEWLERQGIESSIRAAILSYDIDELLLYGPQVVVPLFCTVALTNMAHRYAVDSLMQRLGKSALGPLRTLQGRDAYSQKQLEQSFRVALKKGNRALSDEGAAIQASLAIRSMQKLAGDWILAIEQR